MKKPALFIAALAVAGAGMYLAYPPVAPAKAKRPKNHRSEAAQTAYANRRSVDKLYAKSPNEAREGYRQFVEANKSSKDKGVQEEVGAARMRLGYLEAKLSGFARARHVFLEAEREYAGLGTLGADFGGLKDQASYQAAVTYVAEGRREDAEKAFVKFIEAYPESPLVHAARRRLVTLFPAKTGAYDELLAAAIEKQRKHIALERASCGPRAIAYLLEQRGRATAYEEIAKICKTDETGTSAQNLLEALEAYGFKAEGFIVNRKDFAALHLPSIWLTDDHYVVLCEVSGDTAVVYDPLLRARTSVKLPPADSSDFSAQILRIAPEVRS